MTRSDREKIARFLAEDCRDDLVLFNDQVLGGQPYWSGAHRGVCGQREWAELLMEYSEVVLVSANATGKSWFTYSAAVWWAVTRPYSTVILFAPSLATLVENSLEGIDRVVNGYVSNGVAYKPRIPLEAKLSRGGSARPNVCFSNGSRILLVAANKEENCSGWHGDVFVILEEASGLPDFVFNALGGLCPRKTLIVGNPLSTTGGYYQRHLVAVESRKKGLPPASSSISVHVPASASPHAHLDHSPVGLADKTFITRKKEEEGETSAWYRSHVMALFPTSSSELLIGIEDLDFAISEACRASAEEYRKRANPGENKIYISLDAGQGVGKSKTVIFVRDGYGVLEMIADEHLGIEGAAQQVAMLKHKYNVPDSQTSFDGGGDTGNRTDAALRAEGVLNAWPFFGGDMAIEWGKHFANARSACAFTLARRLARGYFPGVEHGAPFYLPPDAGLVEELKALRGISRGDGKSALIEKDELMRILRRSPDHFDSLSQSFMREARRK